MKRIVISWLWTDQTRSFERCNIFAHAKLKWYKHKLLWSRNWMKFWWYSDFFSHFTQSTAPLSLSTLHSGEKIENVFVRVSEFWHPPPPRIRITHPIEVCFLILQLFEYLSVTGNGEISSPVTQFSEPFLSCLLCFVFFKIGHFVFPKMGQMQNSFWVRPSFRLSAKCQQDPLDSSRVKY